MTETTILAEVRDMLAAARVVRLQPGDVLVLGNVGMADPEALHAAMTLLREQLGVRHIYVFEGDIHLEALTEENHHGP